MSEDSTGMAESPPVESGSSWIERTSSLASPKLTFEAVEDAREAAKQAIATHVHGFRYVGFAQEVDGLLSGKDRIKTLAEANERVDARLKQITDRDYSQPHDRERYNIFCTFRDAMNRAMDVVPALPPR